MPNRILALDLQGSHLAAVLVETSFRSYRFVAHFSEPRDEERTLAEQLRDFVQRNSLDADTVLSALPGAAAAHRILHLPFRDRRKLQQTIPFEIESRVPFALEDVIVDFQVLSRETDGARVFAALAPRPSIEEHLRVLAEAGLEPSVLDFGPLSTLNVLQLFEGERPGRYAFLHVNGGRGTLALYRNGNLDGLRVLDVAGEPLDTGLTREIAWGLRSFDGPPGTPDENGEPLPILIGGTVPPELVEQLRSDLGLTVQRLEELPLRHVPDHFREQQGSYAAAIGLALREIAEAPTLGLNFRQEEFSYRRAQQEFRDLFSRFGILSAVVLVLFLASAIVSYQRLSGEAEGLDRAIRRVFTTTVPNQPVIDETMQLTQAIEGLRRRAQQFGGGPLSVLEVLRELSVRSPDDPRMNVEELTFDADALRLRAKTDSFEAVEAVKRKLAESDLFRDVQVKDPRTTKEGEVEFRLNILFGKESST